MYSSRRSVYCRPGFCMPCLILGLIRCWMPYRTAGGMTTTGRSARNRLSLTLTLVLVFLVIPSLPLCYALYRNYRWEQMQPPTTVVPDLMGLTLEAGAVRAQSAHLETKVLGRTWYTDLSPGRITLQSPQAGQRVPFETTIGLELAVMRPAFAPSLVVNQEGSRRKGTWRRFLSLKARRRGRRRSHSHVARANRLLPNQFCRPPPK